MNILPIEKRDKIIDLYTDGHTVREISAEVGCNRETVSALGLRAYRKKIGDMLFKLQDELWEVHGTDAGDVYTFCELFDEVVFRCPIHPEYYDPDAMDSEYKCIPCIQAGMRRHHARSKANKLASSCRKDEDK